jgi:hypothetical protein
MIEFDETTIRDHLRRRGGEMRAGETVDRLRTAIQVNVREVDQRSARTPRLFAVLPLRARVALAAALVVAISLVAVPLAGGPRSSNPPASFDPTILQVLSLGDLQRVVAFGDTEPYVDRIVVADVDLDPGLQQLTCIREDCPMGRVVGADPTIRVIQPFEDTDILTASVPEKGVRGPVILRVRRTNTVELIGEAQTNLGYNVAWQLPSFINAVRRIPVRLDFRPGVFTVGPPFVVDAKLVQGEAVPCPYEPSPSPAWFAGFGCGLTAWLAPAEVADPAVIIDNSNGRPSDWVRVQNGMYRRFGFQPGGPDATPNSDPRRGFYLVFPLLRYNAELCFDCGRGAVALLYAKLEPVPIP